MGTKVWYRFLRGALYALAALFVFGMWAGDVREFVSLNGYYRAMLIDMVHGTAYKPFVYRCLVPVCTRAILVILPGSVLSLLRQGLGSLAPVVRALRYLGWEQAYLPEYLITLAVMYAALLGFTFTLRRLVSALYESEFWLADLTPIVALAVLPVFFKRGTHLVYDFPTLFLFTLGLLLIYRQRWGSYYAVFVLGLCNKETAILLTLVFVLWHWERMPRRRLALHVAAQIGCFAVVKIILALVYKANPGALFEPHLVENIRLYMRPYWFGAVWDTLAVILLVGYRFSKKPAYLRRSLWIGLLLLPLFLVAGGYAEIRALYELFPIVFLLGFQTVAEILELPMRARPPAAPVHLVEVGS